MRYGRESRVLTRSTAFSRDFKKKGMIKLSTYLKVYRVGDIVDVVANGAVQKGMPYKVRLRSRDAHMTDVRMADTPPRSTTARPASSTT